MEQLRRVDPDDRRAIDDVAGDLDRSYRTVARYVQRGDEIAARTLPRRARRSYWTDERAKAAIRVWIKRHGRPPTWTDWTPAKIRKRAWSTAAARIAAFDEGWLDEDGVHHPFPHASSVPLKRLVAEVLAEDASVSSQVTTASRPSPASR